MIAAQKKKRDLLGLDGLSPAELRGLVERAAELKALRHRGERVTPLAGKTLGMLFEKASTRTRVSFEAGTFYLGGHALMLRKDDMQLGRGEPIADTARVLSRYLDGIMIRTFGHDRLVEFAAAADIPVINGLTDLLHPCQVLADLLTCREAKGAEALGDLVVTWVGDGNNMAHSWINAAVGLGFELRLACPDGYHPDPRVLAMAAAKNPRAPITVLADPRAAADGAHVVTTDVWASMGQEEEQRVREAAFAGYQVNDAVMDAARADAIFLHCLPAHRGEEVTASVIDGPQSRVWDQAENRLHAQNAVMEWLLGGRAPA